MYTNQTPQWVQNGRPLFKTQKEFPNVEALLLGSAIAGLGAPFDVETPLLRAHIEDPYQFPLIVSSRHLRPNDPS